MSAALSVFLIYALGAQSPAAPSPLVTIHAFLSAINQKRYKAAYAYISKPLQEEMSYGDFLDAVERVNSIRLLSVSIVRQTLRFAKARVLVESLERDENDKKWKKRKHAGELLFVPEKGEWRVIQVDIKRFRSKRKRSVSLPFASLPQAAGCLAASEIKHFPSSKRATRRGGDYGIVVS